MDVSISNFNLPHVCIVMDTAAFQVCLGMNLIRQNAKTILGLIFTPSRLIVKNPETDELSLVSLSEKSSQKKGRRIATCTSLFENFPVRSLQFVTCKWLRAQAC